MRPKAPSPLFALPTSRGRISDNPKGIVSFSPRLAQRLPWVQVRKWKQRQRRCGVGDRTQGVAGGSAPGCQPATAKIPKGFTECRSKIVGNTKRRAAQLFLKTVSVKSFFEESFVAACGASGSTGGGMWSRVLGRNSFLKTGARVRPEQSGNRKLKTALRAQSGVKNRRQLEK